MSTPESKVRDPVVRYAKLNGVLHQRQSFRPGVRRAFPDDLFVFPTGFHLWIEFKATGKEPTALQYERLGRLNDMGASAIWTDSKDEGCAVIAHCLAAIALYAPGRGLFKEPLSGGFTAQARRTKDLNNIGRILGAAR